MSDRTLQASTNGGLSFTEGTGVYEGAIAPSNLPTITSADDSDHVLVSDGGTPSKITKANLLSGVGGSSRWTQVTAFNDQAPAQNQITTTSDLTGVITVGTPIKFKMASQAEDSGYFYAICSGITSSTITIVGARLETDDGDLEEVWYGTPEMAVQVCLHIDGPFNYTSGAVTNALHYYDNKAWRWMLGTAYLVSVQVRCGVADSSGDPYFGVYLEGAHAVKMDFNGTPSVPEWTATTSWNEMVAPGDYCHLVDKDNYQINRADDLDIWLDSSMSTGDAADLDVILTFVME